MLTFQQHCFEKIHLRFLLHETLSVDKDYFEVINVGVVGKFNTLLEVSEVDIQPVNAAATINLSIE